MEKIDFDFYRNKSIFITGHTGFKGAYLSRILTNLGAKVTGFALNPPSTPNLFSILHLDNDIKSVIGDIRDLQKLQDTFDDTKVDIVFHLAAQPLVRESYNNPHYTYETNVMGTVNILECVRKSKHVRSFLNVTTDKVYQNNEWAYGYREIDPLDGFDPYSNSKSCSDIITHSYKRSFFADDTVAISTARAGNVIGGGDYATDRILPDCIRSMEKNEPIKVRNPYSTRPYQHVLEPIFAYMLIAMRQYDKLKYQGSYNIGPDDKDCVTTGELCDIFCKSWGHPARWVDKSEKGAVHEATFLKLDCSKFKSTFAWEPRWDIQTSVEKTIEFERSEDKENVLREQIKEYLGGE